MPIKFKPSYSIMPEIANLLLRIKAIKEKVRYLPLTPQVLASLRETARLNTVYYSTMIGGNQLTRAQVAQVIKHEKKIAANIEAALKSGTHDQSDYLHSLDPKQRKALALFSKFKIVTAKQIGELFNFKPRTSAHLCKKWVDSGFLVIVNPSNKGRTYKLTQKIKTLPKS